MIYFYKLVLWAVFAAICLVPLSTLKLQKCKIDTAN